MYAVSDMENLKDFSLKVILLLFINLHACKGEEVSDNVGLRGNETGRNFNFLINVTDINDRTNKEKNEAPLLKLSEDQLLLTKLMKTITDSSSNSTDGHPNNNLNATDNISDESDSNTRIKRHEYYSGYGGYGRGNEGGYCNVCGGGRRGGRKQKYRPSYPTQNYGYPSYPSNGCTDGCGGGGGGSTSYSQASSQSSSYSSG